VDNILHYL